jgi:large repetitive protein
MARRFVSARRLCVFLLAVAALLCPLTLNALPVSNAAGNGGEHDAGSVSGSGQRGGIEAVNKHEEGMSPSITDTTTVVSPSAATIKLGETVTFTATVAPTSGTGTPTGLVTFFDGTTPLGSGSLNQVSGDDQATFSTSLLSASASPHSITATYQGDTNFNTSTSTAISETVQLRTSTTALSLNPTTVAVGQASTITVTVTDSGQVPPGTPDVFSATGAPATGRTGFTATLFADGLVLVAGGTDKSGNVLQSAEIYSVSSGTFAPATGNLNTARTGAVAVLLPNGDVLVAGGSSDGTANGALNSAELFDPVTGTFTTSSENMIAARFGATATLLSDGEVLLAGGEDSGGVLSSAELYNPTADTFTATGNLNHKRTGASATLVVSGTKQLVLVAGGSSDGTDAGALGSGELFDPTGNGGAGTFTAITSTLSVARWQPEAALLLSGNVLIAGGQNSSGTLTSADLYNPATNSFTASAGTMNEARANGGVAALPSGMVLLAGGVTPSSPAAELYDADSDQFDITGSLLQSDNGLVLTLLNDGQALAVGLTSGGTPVSDAELYSPSFNPLGTVVPSSSEPTDAFSGACILAPTTSTASTCTSTVTPANVATSPHTITATYPADAVHSTSNNTANLTVNKASQTITFTTPPPASAAFNSTFNVAATASSGLTVAFTASGSCTDVDNGNGTAKYTMTSGTGTCSVIANQAGNGNYLAAATVTDTVTATKASQTITFTTAPPASAVYNSTFNVAATASSGLTVAFTASGSCTVVDNGNGTAAYTMTSGTGTCSVIANQAGNGSYGAAPTVTDTVNATKASQTITFTTAPPASAVYNSTFNVAATASSGLTVAFTASGSCNVVDNGNGTATYTMTSGTGTCSVIANQAGNGNYAAAPTVTDTVNATKIATSIAVTSVSLPSEFYGQDAQVTITAVLTWTGTGAAPTASDVTIGGNGPSTPYGATTCMPPSGDTITCTATYKPTVADVVASSPYTETATFTSDSNYSKSNSPQTGNFSITQATTTTAAVTFTISGVNATTGYVNQVVTFGTTVAPENSGIPTGTVTVTTTPAPPNANPLCVLSLANAMASCTPTTLLAAATYTVNAVYGGDSNFKASSSAPSSLVVNPTATTTTIPITLTQNNCTSTAGATSGITICVQNSTLMISFTGQVTPTITAPPGYTGYVPNQTITFEDNGSTALCTTGPLNNVQQASCSIADTLAMGTHEITAVYSTSDPNFTTSTSAATPVTVPSPSTISSSILSGQSGAIDLTTSTSLGAATTVGFSCSAIGGTAPAVPGGLVGPSPAGNFTDTNGTAGTPYVTCYFSDVSVTGPGATTTLTVCTVMPQSTSCTSQGTPAIVERAESGRRWSPFGLGLAMPALAFVGIGTFIAGSGRVRLGRRGLFRAFGILVGSALLCLLLSCGGGFSGTVVPPQSGSGQTPVGSYTLTITGSGSDGSVEIYNVQFSVIAH